MNEPDLEHVPLCVFFHSGTADEIQAILRDGFTDGAIEIKNGLLKRGVYIADAPGAPDPDYPLDQLLKITLAPEIDLRKWRLLYVIPEKPCRWREWIVPADLLNKHARIRLLTGQEWKELWTDRGDIKTIMRGFDSLVADGYFEIARDAQGEPVYHDGEPVYTLSEKGRALKTSGQMPPPPQEQ